MNLPNLLVIGAMKAGSTSLHDYLNLHPDIFMSEKKEIDFFVGEKHYGKGLDWYKAHFPVNASYRGESSINYTKKHVHGGVPERIKNDLDGNVKFIYVVRNPVDRFISNFTDSKTYGHIPPDYSINNFVKNLDENPLIKTSMYFFQINEYLKYFPRDNFCFIKSDELKANPQVTMGKVFDFLNLASIPVKFEIEKNTSGTKTYPSNLGVFFNNNPVVRLIKKVLSPTGIRNLKRVLPLEALTRKRFDKRIDTLSKENYIRIQSYLKEDMLAFGNLSGLDISGWLK